MPTKPRLAVYALLWVGLSAALYPLLPKLKYAPRPTNTTTVPPDTAPDAKRLALAPIAETPKKDEPKRQLVQVEPARKEPEAPKKEPETPKKKPEPPKKEPETPKKEPESPKKVLLPEIFIGKERRPGSAWRRVYGRAIGPSSKNQDHGQSEDVDGSSYRRRTQASTPRKWKRQEIVVLDDINTQTRIKLLARNGRVVLRQSWTAIRIWTSTRRTVPSRFAARWTRATS